MHGGDTDKNKESIKASQIQINIEPVSDDDDDVFAPPPYKNNKVSKNSRKSWKTVLFWTIVSLVYVSMSLGIYHWFYLMSWWKLERKLNALSTIFIIILLFIVVIQYRLWYERVRQNHVKRVDGGGGVENQSMFSWFNQNRVVIGSPENSSESRSAKI